MRWMWLELFIKVSVCAGILIAIWPVLEGVHAVAWGWQGNLILGLFIGGFVCHLFRQVHDIFF